MINFDHNLNRKSQKMRRLILTCAVLLCICYGANAASAWERTGGKAQIERVEGDAPEVRVSEGYVYVTASRPTTVKVFSILGQLISQETIQPGISRFRLPSRGIYILKVGTMTKRITI